MPRAVAIVAHHDDHVLWMGGAIQRLAASGWDWTIIAMCVPERDKVDYFHLTCSEFGALSVAMPFQDYYDGDLFSRNNRDEMRSRLHDAINGQEFDLVFTHSRSRHGEYWLRHTNHFEVREVAAELVSNGTFGRGIQHLVYFSYDVIYGKGTATCADTNANYYLQLTYPELLRKCRLCSSSPDANASLINLAFPCPNPEAFEGDQLDLPEPFVQR